MAKTASTRDIIRLLKEYEKKNGIGSVESIATVSNGTRKTEYIFYITDNNGDETKVEVPTVDKNTLWD